MLDSKVNYYQDLVAGNTASTITGDGGGATVGVNAAKNQTAVTDVQTSKDLGSQGA